MHNFTSNSSGGYLIWPQKPDKVAQTDFFSVNSDSEAVIMFPTSVFRKRKVHEICIGLYVADIWNTTSDGYAEELASADLSIELYSGKANELLNLSYNVLFENAQKHKWYDEEENITITASEEKREYDLSIGISGIQQVIDSADDTILLRFQMKKTSNNINIYNLYGECTWIKGKTWSLAPVLKNPIPDNATIYSNKKQSFSWDYEGDGVEQESYEIGWSSDEGKTWNSEHVISDKKEHLYQKGIFPEKVICWRVKSTNKEGTSGEYLTAEFIATIQRPTVEVVFPSGINISNEKDQIFTWKYFGEDIEQKYYEIGISSDDGKTWTKIQIESSEQYHVFEKNSIPTGHILWSIRAINSEGYASEYSYGEFDAVGQSDAPKIESITQNAIPTIKWTAVQQEAFEIQISGEHVKYESGMIPGAETREFRPNIMLENGKYEFKIRILNSYGKITDWDITTFFLSASKTSSNPILMLKENELYGVSLSGTGILGKGFYVRKEVRSQTTTYKNTHMTVGKAWNTKNISVGDFISGIAEIEAEGYFVHKQEVKKDDVLTLNGSWANGHPDNLYSDRFVVTNLDYMVIDIMMFEDFADVRTYTFKEDGYFFLCEKNPTVSGFELFELKKIINKNYPETFEEKEVIVAEYEKGKVVVDCDLIPGINYLYVLRDYIDGYTDSEIKIYFCNFDGVIFQDIENPEDIIHVRLNASEYVGNENSYGKNTTYKQCVGREYPVKESSYQKNEKIVVTGFLDVQETKKAQDMFLKDRLVIYRDENHCCYADICNFKKKRFFDKGYIVEIIFERIDGKKEVRLV